MKASQQKERDFRRSVDISAAERFFRLQEESTGSASSAHLRLWTPGTVSRVVLQLYSV